MKNKVDIIKELWEDDPSLSDEELDKRFDIGFDMMEEIAQSQDVGLLPDLLELFTDRNEDFGGVCERLLNDIWDNYTTEQIIEAISKKFDYLVENDITRAVQFVGYSMNLGYFDDMRRIFNETKSKYSAKFLDKFEKWYMKDYPNEIALLREDMKKW